MIFDVLVALTANGKTRVTNITGDVGLRCESNDSKPLLN